MRSAKPSPLTSPALATEQPLKSASAPSRRKPLLPSSDDSGMTAGNSVARATGVHAVEARTARANTVRRDRAELPDFTDLLIIGIAVLPLQTCTSRHSRPSIFRTTTL